MNKEILVKLLNINTFEDLKALGFKYVNWLNGLMDKHYLTAGARLQIWSNGKIKIVILVHNDEEYDVYGFMYDWLDSETFMKILTVSEDEDLAMMGFSCKGQLCEYPGFETVYERLCLWSNGQYCVISVDCGNCYCGTLGAIPIELVPEVVA